MREQFCAEPNKSLDLVDLTVVSLGDGWVLAEVCFGSDFIR